MKFSIGDRILLKQTDEEGFVTGYINEQMLEVEVNGTKFPVYLADIDHPYLKWFTEKKQQKKKTPVVPEQLPVEKTAFPKERLAKGISLSFMPEYKTTEMEEVVEWLKIYLVNELPRDTHFHYEVKVNEASIFMHEGSLAAFSHIYLHKIPFELVHEKPTYNWTISDADSHLGLNEEKGSLKIKPVKLFEQLHNLQTKNEAMFNYLLVQDFKKLEPKKKQEPLPAPPPAPAKREKPKYSLQDIPRYEIDLHVENLVTDLKGLTNADMLHIQLEYLDRYLRLAINAKMDKVIIIHGLGRGVLKDAVHRILKETPEVGNYVNEWHANYGYGATQVYFKYW